MPRLPSEPTGPSPAQLSARADELRRLARSIESADLGAAAARSGPDTWAGSGPQRCADELAVAEREVGAACTALRRRAAELDGLAADAILRSQLPVPIG